MNFLCFFVMGWLSDLMIVTHVCIKCNQYVILFVRLLRVVESISFNDTGLWRCSRTVIFPPANSGTSAMSGIYASLRHARIITLLRRVNPRNTQCMGACQFNHHYPNRVSLGKRKELKSADYFHLATEDRYEKSSFRGQGNFCSPVHMCRWKEDDPLDHPCFWFCPTGRE